MKRKICVVITARPSYSRIKSALIAIKNHPMLELQLVVAGSALLGRYGNVVDYIEKDGFFVDEKVFMVLEGENPTHDQLVAEPPNGYGLPIKVEKIFEIIKGQKEY